MLTAIAAVALSQAAPAASVETPDAIVRRYGLAGEMLIAKGGRVVLHRAYGTIAPGGGRRHRTNARWRLASITKQVLAVNILNRLAGERLTLDDPLTKQPVFADLPLGSLTMRQLLTHHSGLANPDSTPEDAQGVPSFYTKPEPDFRYCVSKPAVPGSPFSYNNCDYVVADNHIVVTPLPMQSEWPRGMAMARRDEVGVPGFVKGRPEPRFQLAAWSSSGGLMGTARAVFDFDRALMAGKLLSNAARDELWRPEGNGSYQALGQWVFPGRLRGCAAPKRIVQRDGEIYGVQARNFIFPDDDMVVIVLTNRSSDDFAMGEVWQGKGFTYDLLSAVACA